MGKGSIMRDDNFIPIQSNGAIIVKKAVTYTATGEGSVAAHTLFTVTGDVLVSVFGICNTDLTSGGVATLEAGVTGNTAILLAQITATNLDDGDVYVDATNRIGAAGVPASTIVDSDIIATVGTATITAGQVDFYCMYRPLEASASVVAA